MTDNFMVALLKYLGLDCSVVLQILEQKSIDSSLMQSQESKKKPALPLCCSVLSQMLDSGREQRFQKYFGTFSDMNEQADDIFDEKLLLVKGLT